MINCRYLLYNTVQYPDVYDGTLYSTVQKVVLLYYTVYSTVLYGSATVLTVTYTTVQPQFCLFLM